MPVRTGVAERPHDLQWLEWTLSRAETDCVVAASRRLGATVTSLLTSAIWTAIKYVSLQSDPQQASGNERAFVAAIIVNTRRTLKPENRTHARFPGWPTLNTSGAVLTVPAAEPELRGPARAEFTLQHAIREAYALVPPFVAELKSCLGPEAFPARVADTFVPSFFVADRFWDPSDPAGPMGLVISSLGVLDPPEHGLLPAKLTHPDGCARARRLSLCTEDFHFRIRAFKRCNGFHPYTVGGRLTNVLNYNARLVDPAVAAETMRVSKLVLLSLAAEATPLPSPTARVSGSQPATSPVQ